jgi:hypothetical protein
MMSDHSAQVERLLRSFRRDLSSLLLESSGLRERTGVPRQRLLQTWDRLCESDLDVAAVIQEILFYT